MKLKKGNDVVELTSRGHIDAYKQAGWVEYVELPKTEKPKMTKAKAEK